MKKSLSIIVASLVAASSLMAAPIKEVVMSKDVKWTHLNPKRGDLAPSAGTLWGDRNANVPTGYLLKPNDGFQSPPHIHNISYRAVVISGLLHNDDPNAENMWLGTGSFWTQPKGTVHITSSKAGTKAIAYIEIEEGPYLVLPPKEAFHNDDQPLNLDKSNVVWLDSKDVKWIDANNNVKVSYLWKDKNGFNGTFIKLPAKFSGKIKMKGTELRGIVVDGKPQYTLAKNDVKTLEPGSYFGSKDGATSHHIKTNSEKETILYIRTNGRYSIVSDKK